MKKGFTLIEVLISIGIIGVIMIVISVFYTNILNSNRFGNDSLKSSDDARSILRTMVREMRSAKPGNNGAYPVLQAATSSISFYSDVDADGLQDQIRYFLVGTTLKKGLIKPTGSPLAYVPANEKLTILANDIKNSTSTSMFEYFDNTYTGTSSPLTQPVSVATVRLVKINLLIDADPLHSPLPRVYTSQAMLRNLKDNL